MVDAAPASAIRQAGSTHSDITASNRWSTASKIIINTAPQTHQYRQKLAAHSEHKNVALMTNWSVARCGCQHMSGQPMRIRRPK